MVKRSIEERKQEIRERIAKAEQARQYSLNTREDFFTLLTNVGGVMTLPQAQCVLEKIDGGRVPTHIYRPDKFFYSEVAARRITIDYERKLLYEGPKKDLVYDPSVLWGFSYVLRNAADLNDILSPVVTTGQDKSITYTCNKEYQKLFFVNHSTVANLGRQIAANEQAISKMPMNPDLIRPLYVIFITETERSLVEATLDKLEALGLGYKHRVVVPSGGWHDNQADFTEYDSVDEDAENEVPAES